MIRLFLPLLVLISAAAAGVRWQDPPFRVNQPGLPIDSVILEHRDSPYNHATWVASESTNAQDLFFYNTSQGGVCLLPRWDEYARKGLEHLRPRHESSLSASPNQPNPGTLAYSSYVCLYPAAVILNQRLRNNLSGELKNAPANIFMVGLGSGAGISVLAHHFPESSITVVEIDPVVVEMAMSHYPFLRWLAAQHTSDGRPRLSIVAADARLFLHRPQARRYDIALLDAYTLGMMVPAHLMTKEFFQELMQIMEPDGIVLSNIAASCRGRRHELLSGAVKTMHAAGLNAIYDFPVALPREARAISDEAVIRNHIVLASRQLPAPNTDVSGWAMLKSFQPYAELHADQFVTRTFQLVNSKQPLSAVAPLFIDQRPIDLQFDSLLTQQLLASSDRVETAGGYVAVLNNSELLEAAQHAVRAHYAPQIPTGWGRAPKEAALLYEETDWVVHARQIFQDAVSQAMFFDGAESLTRFNEPACPLNDGVVFTDARPNADLAG